MGCVSVSRAGVALFLLVTCLSTATQDDLTNLGNKMTKTLQKLQDIEKRLKDLENLPQEAREAESMLSTIIKLEKAHSKCEPPSATQPKKVFFNFPNLAKPAPKKQVDKGKQGAQSAEEKSDLHFSTTSGSKMPSDASDVSDVSDESDESDESDVSGVSNIVLVSTKKTFLLDLKTKTWTDLAVTPHPDSLLYDDVHHRLYWSTRKPGAVGFFTGKNWTSQVLYQTNEGTVKGFTVDKQSGEVFVTEAKEFGISLAIVKPDGQVNNDESLWFSSPTTVLQVVVNATSKTLYISIERGLRKEKKLNIIQTLSYTYGGKGQTNKTNYNYGHVNAFVFDPYKSVTLYNDDTDLHWMRFGVKNDILEEPLLKCPDDIQLVTTNKHHLYVFDKKNMYVYDRLYQLKDTIQLPDLNGEEMKATAVVNFPWMEHDG